ncbi:hypothetical protein LX36DRAFT_594015, partial [Colletotrichum falcatum]
KGGRLVILVHGGPVPGKTLTAESVAELSKRPLCREAWADVGTGPENVEDCLGPTGLERNALVPVVLRALEYYNGVLLLTSNKGEIAIRFLMQLPLHYPPHLCWVRTSRPQSIPTTQCAEGQLVSVSGLRGNVRRLAEHKLNGRWLRNAATAARRLARFRNKRLGCGHIQTTMGVVSELEMHVEETRVYFGGFAKDSNLGQQ